jgi:hypothetical protein
VSSERYACKSLRNARILALRGKKSLLLIARQFGVSKGVVAGVFHRADWPAGTRTGRKRNKCGVGYRTGPPAEETLSKQGARA